MSVIIGSARQDERGRYSGGSAGDQTGKEVSTQNYYAHAKGWYVLRPVSSDTANAMAEAMRQACANDKIGYDQSQRLGVISALNKYGTLGKIASATECDCSSLVRACCIQAGIKDPGNFNTANEAAALEATGAFESRKSVSGSSDLCTGDVLVTKTKGHTVIVISGKARGVSSSGTSDSGKIVTISDIQRWAGTAADGICGPKTRAAVIKKAQSAIGVKADGIFGMKSRGAWHTLRKGDTGAAVKALQAMLICRGFSVGPDGADGDFGQNTENAVRGFQNCAGIGVDGIAGRVTAGRLFE